ncbi:hypothetical protein HAZT_HAZT011807 [Hyalella azteca]|uniref:BHLH domain-containing protein n=1 Tax=Hyalella azteca TaxID=294128 RepID=A0A6A0H253_HYAAZ|nr:hypothetical protein HAZT_HAZT011807 [Hyalella azteca]
MACEIEPMSRTYQYRKVMKPMLERKRRARINKCLDELKDLMVGALQNEGDSIAKLEKADVLELTVTHLKKLRQRGQLALKPLPNLQEKYREAWIFTNVFHNFQWVQFSIRTFPSAFFKFFEPRISFACLSARPYHLRVNAA